MKKTKKILAAVLALCMATSAMPVFAATAVESNSSSAAMSTMSITYEVIGTGVRLRNGPGLSYTALESMFPGEMLTGTSNQVVADGYTWVEVQRRDTGTWGWAALMYLQEC